MDGILIRDWKKVDEQKVIDLIVSIQRNEFNINITADDQPDLRNVVQYYKKGKGNFWVAVAEESIVGTIALIDFGKGQGALRKMFVHKEYRGKTIGLSQQLLDQVKQWCTDNSITDIYLGTVEVLKAAQRFYEKNGFNLIDKACLPDTFPLMQVDTVFYHLRISNTEK